jgi:hypothetical protein
VRKEGSKRGCTYANEIGTLFEDDNPMSYASQRDGTGEASSATTNDDKTDPERCLLCGCMITRLDGTWGGDEYGREGRNG